MTEASIKKWTQLLVSIIGLLAAAHVAPLVFEIANGDNAIYPHAVQIHSALIIAKALLLSVVAVINAFGKEAN